MARATPKDWRKYYARRKAKKAQSKAKSASDVKALASGMNVTVHDEYINTLGADFAYRQLNMMNDLFNEFDADISKHITGVYKETLGENTYAVSHGGIKAKLGFNPKYYADLDRFKASYDRDVRTNWHPQGTSYEHVAVHEAGHRLSQALSEKFSQTGVLPTGETFPQGIERRVQVWSDAPTNRLIVLAKRNVKKATGMKADAQVWDISRYAHKNNQETYAEAITDWYVNRDKAKPLSKEIVKLTKEYLNG